MYARCSFRVFTASLSEYYPTEIRYSSDEFLGAEQVFCASNRSASVLVATTRLLLIPPSLFGMVEQLGRKNEVVVAMHMLENKKR